MPRSRYQQQEAARKRWRNPSANSAGRPRPIAYRVIRGTHTGGWEVLSTHHVEGTDAKSLQRAYRRAKREADNVNGTVKPLYE